MREKTIDLKKLSPLLAGAFVLAFATTGFAQKAATPAPQKPATQAAPATPATRELGKFQDWTAYSFVEGKVRTCYLMGRPKASEPKGAKRDDFYLMVTHRPDKKVRNEVSIYLGYTLKDKSNVEAALGSQKFSLFGHEDAAWALNAEGDKAIVDSLLKGGNLVVKGTSARGTNTQDTYALAGFAQAHKAISTACP